MLFATLLKQKILSNKILSNNLIYNNFKKNLFTNVNRSHKGNFENEYINKKKLKQLKITNSTCCKYCKGTGWIIWETNNNLYDLKSNKSLVPLFSYSLCYKCI